MATAPRIHELVADQHEAPCHERRRDGGLGCDQESEALASIPEACNVQSAANTECNVAEDEVDERAEHLPEVARLEPR